MEAHELGDIRYSIDHDKRILYAERHDNLNKSRVYAEWKAMQQLDGFDPAYDTLVDYSAVTSVELDYDAVRELNCEMPHRDPRTGNIAIVSGLTPGRYLLARFFCLISNLLMKRKHQVFHNSEQAEAWLLDQRNPV